MGDSVTSRQTNSLSWLLTLRWAAVAGQASTILVVHFGFNVVLPLSWLYGIIALEALSNVIAQQGEWDEPEDLVGLLMIIDLLALTGLLYFSGGPHNPFNFLFLVHIALASVVLPARATWVLVGLSAALFAMLFVDHVPLPDPSSASPSGGGHGGHAGHAGHSAGGMDAMTMHVRGMWVGFAVAAIFIAYFVSRVRRELAEARRRVQVNERLAGLATLAAGAAHELGTPLATIAVVAKELEHYLTRVEAEADAVEDAQLIRREVDRCREVLEHMSVEAGESVGEALQEASLANWLSAATKGLSGADRVVPPEGADAVTVYGPQRALMRALRSVIRNGLDAGATTVKVTVAGDADARIVEVADDGSGMDADTLGRAGDPFFTTKAPGDGMGLGLFLARTLMERIGGGLTVTSAPGKGTTVRFAMPRRG